MREQTDDVVFKNSCQHGLIGLSVFVFGAAFVVARRFGSCQHGEVDVCLLNVREQTDNVFSKSHVNMA